MKEQAHAASSEAGPVKTWAGRGLLVGSMFGRAVVSNKWAGRYWKLPQTNMEAPKTVSEDSVPF